MAIERLGLTAPRAPASAGLRGPLALAMSTFFVWGLAYGLLDVLNKHFQETLHVGKAQSTWLQIAYFGAYLLVSLPAGRLLQRRGYRFGVLSGLVLAAVGAFLFVPSASALNFRAFVAATFVMASGLCVLETAADTYVTVLGPPDGAEQRLNLAQSFNGLGVFIGPIIGGAAFFGRGAASTGSGGLGSVQVVYGVVGALVLLFAAALSRARLPEIQPADAGGDDAPGERRPLWRRRRFVLAVITQALYIGAQVGCGAFFINAATELWRGMTSQAAAFLLSLAMAGYLVGRFASTALMSRVSPRAVLTAYGLVNVVLCLMVAAGLGKVSVICLIAIFFFMSAMFATIFTLGVKGLGDDTKRASSIMVMAIGGGIVLPYPMGLIAQARGTPAAFVLPALCFALVAFYGWKGAEPERRQSGFDDAGAVRRSTPAQASNPGSAS
jgi:FHS family L-fucose permease-like MFS transporter